MSISRWREDRGFALVLVSLMLLTFLAFAAIVVDIGNQRQTKRRAQNALDAAALAGVADYDGLIGTEGAARAKAVTMLGLNSFPGVGGSGNNRTCGSGDDCTITFGFNNNPDRPCMSVSITNLRVITTFGRALGADRLNVSVTGQGCKTFSAAGGGLPAGLAFGACSTPHETFDTSGNDNRFVGNIHSNGGARDTGSNNTRTGTASATGTATGPLWTPYTSSSQDDPLAPGVATPQQLIARYAPGGDLATQAQGLGLYTNAGSSEIKYDTGAPIPAGIYYTTGKITIGGEGTAVSARNGHNGVVLVSAGNEIVISGNGARLTPFTLNNPNRLTVVAGWGSTSNPCSDKAFIMGGECNRVDGVMYVPFRLTDWGNNGNGHDDNGGTTALTSSPRCTDTPTYRGGLVTWALKFQGNYHVLRGGPGGSVTSFVFLDE